MADTRLPDVVPVNKDVASVVGDTIIVMTGDPLISYPHTDEDHPADQPPLPLRVEIWTDSISPPGSPSSHPLLDSSVLVDRRVSTGHHSDSGIDSLLPSPTVSNSEGGHHRKKLQQTFVLDLSAQHLAVPGQTFRTFPSSQQHQEGDKPDDDDGPLDDDCRSAAEECDDEDSDPEAGRRITKRSPKNLQVLDCDATKAETTTDPPELGSSRIPLMKTSNLDNRPQSSCSVESEVAAAAFHPGSFTSSSRQPSFTSVRSECTDPSVQNSNNASSKSHQLTRSSSSRSTFLSVPFSKILNGLSSSPERRRHQQQQQEHQQQQSHRRPSLQSSHPSGASSASSLMASRFSLSKSLSPTASPYLRLPMTDEMMARRSARNSREDRHHLYHSTVDGGLLMMDDPCYEPGPGPSASLSLTQRLAFPQLVEGAGPQTSVKTYGRGYNNQELPREEGSLNFFAKIITFLVLVFVIVLVVGVLVKSSHTPR